MNNRSLHPHRLRITFLALRLCCWGCAVVAIKNPAGEPAVPPALTVMTYNLRFASATPPNAWSQRRPLVRELITNQAPDVIGTQEGLHAQLQELAVDLPEYEWTGVGRDGGTKGEFMAVFYRKARLESLSTNHFWLSDTPEVVGSKTWGPKFARMVTWLKFRDRLTRQEFVLFNTHFDHEVQIARERGAEMIRQRVATLDAKLPVLVIGDFNAAAGANRAYEIMTNGGYFKDAWEIAGQRQGVGIGTFNGFKAANPDGVRIDWILTRGDVAVPRAETVTFTRDGQFPSDHFPVVAQVRFSR
jgi:endonuclease/exonuclease/phosphatase family metal-dependent hydrolase